MVGCGRIGSMDDEAGSCASWGFAMFSGLALENR
jgi:hypothetical protein